MERFLRLSSAGKIMCFRRRSFVVSFFSLFLSLGGGLQADPLTDGYWDGRLWPSLPQVNLIALDDQRRLLAAGNHLVFFPFSPPATNVGPGPSDLVCWDGQRWTALATNAPGPSALAVRGSEIFLAGSFTAVDGIPAAHIARLTNGVWSALGDGLPAAPTILLPSTNLLLAASDARVANQSGYPLWVWDGANWAVLGTPLNQSITAVLATNNTIFVASSPNILKWTGADWMQYAAVRSTNDLPPQINSLGWANGALLLAGMFDQIDGVNAKNVGIQRNGTWSQLGVDLPSGTPQRIAALGTNIFLAGAFTYVDSTTVHGAIFELDPKTGSWFPFLAKNAYAGDLLIERGPDLFATAALSDPLHPRGTQRSLWQFNGVRWAPINNGIVGGVPTFYRLAPSSNGVAVGTLPSVPITSPILWDGTSFQTPSTGLTADYTQVLPLHDIATIDRVVYAHAQITVNHSYTNILARLTNNVWVQATTPMSIAVSALAGANGTIYVGGYTSGGGAVAAWDGQQWTFLGGLFHDGGIRALAIYHGLLFAGGTFTDNNQQPATFLVAWDGSAWRSAGTFDGAVVDLAVANDRLFAVGSFTNVNAVQVNGVAVFDGQSWSTLNRGLPGKKLSCIAATADGLIAIGGAFQGAEGVNCTNVILWRRDHWAPLGSGTFALDPAPNFLLWRGHDLYMTGSFLSVGGILSPGFAIWHEPGVLLDAQASPASIDLSLTGAAPANFSVQQSSDLREWQSVGKNPLGATRFIIPNLTTAKDPAFFRIRGSSAF